MSVSVELRRLCSFTFPALLLVLAASAAHAGPFLTVTGPIPGPDPGTISVFDIPFTPPPVGVNGDFNAAPDFLQYWFSANGFTHSGTAVSPWTPAPVTAAAVTLTGPPSTPVPAFFNPGAVAANSGYIVGGPGNTSIRVTDVHNLVPGLYAQAAVFTGFVFFPTTTGTVLLNLRVEGPIPDLLTTGVIVNPGTAGSIVPFVGVSTLLLPPRFFPGATTFAYNVDVHVMNGPAGVFLPTSAQISLQKVPEPSSLVMASAGFLALLGYNLRRRRAGVTLG